MGYKLPIYYSHEYKIRFAAIPKNASNAIKKYLGMDIRLDWYDFRYAIRNPDGFGIIEGYPLLIVLRNPLDRWFSTYNYLRGGLNNISYKSYLSVFRNVGVGFNNHLVKQSDYNIPHRWVITMEDLERAFPGIEQTNRSVTNNQAEAMPDDVVDFYKEDFNWYNEVITNGFREQDPDRVREYLSKVRG